MAPPRGRLGSVHDESGQSCRRGWLPADVKLLRWLLSPCPHSSATLLLLTPAHGSSTPCQGIPLPSPPSTHPLAGEGQTHPKLSAGASSPGPPDTERGQKSGCHRAPFSHRLPTREPLRGRLPARAAWHRPGPARGPGADPRHKLGSRLPWRSTLPRWSTGSLPAGC